MNIQLFWDGVKAMILGMGMVYLFLIIMIQIMNLTAKLLKPYAGFLEPEPEKKPGRNNGKPAALSDNDAANAAVAAVKLFRQNPSSSVFSIPVNGRNVSVSVHQGGENTAPAAAPAANAGTAVQSGNGALQEICSPLPGTIVKLSVHPGDTIAAGDTVAVIEAMKMETEIRSEHAGTVREVFVAVKEVVAADQLILSLEENK